MDLIIIVRESMKVNTKKSSNIFYCIIVFMYIFMFRIVGFIDSSIVVGILLIFLVLSSRYAISIFSKIINSHSFRSMLICFCLICIWLTISTCVNGANDFSFFKTWFHVLLQIVIGSLLYAYLESKNVGQYIINYLIIAFVMQTIIEWLALVSPTVKAFIYMTKDENTIRIADQYGGIRGLSLAGSSFFGLAIAFGLAFILYWTSSNTLLNKHPIFKFLLFCFIVSGTFFAGRVGLIGIVILIIYAIYEVVVMGKPINIQKLVKISVVLIALIITVILVAKFTKNSDNPIFIKLGYLSDYVFEAFKSLFNGNGFSTTSTSELFGEMYFSLPLETLVLGDGYYTDPITGGYYKNTDSGYMRTLLYGGLPFMVLLIIFQKKIFDLSGNKKNKIIHVIWLFLFITQIKGEVIGLSLITLNMNILFSISSFVSDKKQINDYRNRMLREQEC